MNMTDTHTHTHTERKKCASEGEDEEGYLFGALLAATDATAAVQFRAEMIKGDYFYS